MSDLCNKRCLYRRWLVAVAAAGLLSLQGCGQRSSGEYSGFIEGDFIRPAPVAGGTLEELHVDKGSEVAKGDPLFALDDAKEKAAVAAAESALAEATSKLQNLKYGRRPEEIAVIKANEKSAEARLKLAKLTYDRAVDLLAQAAVSKERRDTAKAEYDAAEAAVASVTAELKVAELPARKDEIEAAEAAVNAASASLDEARWRLGERKVVAPASGRIEDRYFLAGDFVPAGAAVVALLPASQVKLKFYVPETEISGLQLGQTVDASCDGCSGPIKARISFIAKQAEFTPPVIYSEKARSKLMFRVEARPLGDAAQLHPGQPIDVTVE